MKNEARLIMHAGPDCWDRLRLLIHDDNAGYTRIVRLKDRYTAIDAYRQTAIAFYTQKTGDLTLKMDEGDYSLCETSWKAVHSCLDQWFTEYFLAVESNERDTSI
mgnify:CR=1 FL=1